MQGHRDTVNHVEFSNDSISIGTASEDGTVRLWNRSTGKQIAKLKESGDNSVTTCHFSPDGVLIAALVDADKIRIWNCPLQNVIMVVKCSQQGPLRWCEFSPDGNILATASEDASFAFWDVSETSGEAKLVHLTKGAHSSGIKYLTFSASSKYMASAGYDKTVHIWI